MSDFDLRLALSVEFGKYAECATCSAKPGAPTLCAACLHNREMVGRLERERDEARAEVERLRAQVEARVAFSDVIVAKANGYKDRVDQQRRRGDDALDVARRAIAHGEASERRAEEAEAEVKALRAAALAALSFCRDCDHEGGCRGLITRTDRKYRVYSLCDEHGAGDEYEDMPYAEAYRALAVLVGK